MEDAPDFRCEYEWLGEDSAVIVVEGELDLHTSSLLQKVLRDLGAQRITKHLVADLTRCTFVDSTGLAVLVAAQRRAETRLTIVACNEQVVGMLEMTGLDRVFEVHASRRNAFATVCDASGELCA